MYSIDSLFTSLYSEAEKNLFTEALNTKTQIQKTRLNYDTFVYTVNVLSLKSFCVIFVNMDSVYFKNFEGLEGASDLHAKIVLLYGS